MRVGPYRLKRIIGAGGMGVVYEASDERLARPVAIKFIASEASDFEMVRRFGQERDTLAALRHPAIAHIYDAGEAEHKGEIVPYIVMEYVVGARTISSGCRDSGLTLPQILEVFESLFDALDHAHRRGIVHRDLKPGNILMDSEGKPKIIDFGLSLPTGARAAFDSLNAEGGKPVGTYRYMSPEQRRGDPMALDHRTDLFSLAFVLLELLEDMHPAIPQSVAEVIDRALKSEPAQRTSSAAMIRDQLRVCRDEIVVSESAGPQADSRNSGITAGGIVVFSVSAVAAAIIGFVAMVPILCGVSPVCQAFITSASSLAAGGPDGFERVGVVMIDDDTLASAPIAGEIGPVSLRGMRPFYDDLLDRLVEAGAGAIVLDIQLPKVIGHDMAPLAESIEKAKAEKIPVVLMDRAWPDSLKTSGLDPVLYQAASAVAAGAAICEPAGPWWVVLAARPRDGLLLPGLATAGFAFENLPQGTLFLEAKHENDHLEIRRYKSPSAGGDQVGGPIAIEVSAWTAANESALRIGLAQDDEIATLMLNMPPDSELARATTSFEDALTMPPDMLRDRLGGKTVVIAAISKGTGEIAIHPDGRPIAKAYAHAQAIETLYQQFSIRLLDDFLLRLLAGLGAVAGVVIGFVGAASRKFRVITAVVIAGGLIATAFALAAGGLLIPPSPVVAGLAVGFGIAEIVRTGWQRPKPT